MASLQDKYLGFLANPTTDVLSPKASLHYVPTLTTLNEPIGILKHLKTQQQCVAKNSEKILAAVEGSNSLCLETETTLQFILGGATYLPGLDDNFLVDKVVTAAIVHVVSFDADQKILQIRLHWDQASLLKAVDTIGTRGRNWPVNSGLDQARLVAQSVAAAAPLIEAASATAAADERTGRPKSRGVDPHSTLALFANREVVAREDSPGNLVSPRASAKPAPREWGDLFANGEAPTVAEALRSPSPSKGENHIKAGAGKYHQGMRLFNQDNVSAEKGIKTDAKKYNHFEFGEADFVPSPIKNSRSKHMSQWDFADFDTPLKQKERRTPYPSRNFDFNEHQGEPAAVDAPVWTQHVPQPRPDASAHFEITDEVPTSEMPDRTEIARAERGKDLYENHIPGPGPDASNQNTSSGEKEKRPLSNITNQNATNSRHTNFDSSWEPKDHPSPAPPGNENQESKATLPKKNIRNTLPAWDFYEESLKQAEPQRGIKILGNASGSSRAADRGYWDN